MAGFLVQGFTARTERGWTGIAHILRDGRVLDRVATAPVASERQALEQAADEARQRVLRRILGEFLCP
ncbi:MULTISPECIES: hypothetical protein [Ramlibacter]|uniref:Uncharacterized protein n=1 Tax=Ramlibacter aquaticus TaxID=2780094 RepID=A0ABR9SGT1_9BURK|nr:MULTISPECIES: hypothetical protein [Ramlibacter]MBE7941558.1 hypothetical protein [Ramlibacter aquaticus]